MATPPATLPVLHRLLGIGLMTIAVVFLILRYLDIPPTLQHDSVTQVIGYTLSGLGVVIAAVALFVFKPRVPDRSPGESVEQYWSRPEIGPKAMMVWIILDGRSDGRRRVSLYRRAGGCNRRRCGDRRVLVVRSERVRKSVKGRVFSPRARNSLHCMHLRAHRA
jgi:hypothetical protein